MFNLQNFALPNFGLMTKADKLKLDNIPSDTLITAAVASDTFLAKTDSATFLTAADLQAMVADAGGD